MKATWTIFTSQFTSYSPISYNLYNYVQYFTPNQPKVQHYLRGKVLALIAVWLSLLLTLLLLELQVTVVKHCTSEPVDGHLLVITEAQNVDSSLYLKENIFHFSHEWVLEYLLKHVRREK